MAKVNINKWAQVGVVFSLLAASISWLYTLFFKNGIANITFAVADIDVGTALKGGVDTSLGGKLIGMLNGIFPIGGTWIGNLLTLAISGFIVIVAGRYIYEWFTFFRARSSRVKLMTVATYGSLLVGVILALMGGKITGVLTWGFLQVMAATAIAFLIVASVYLLVNKFMPKIAILPE